MAGNQTSDFPLRNGQDAEDIQGDILAGFNKDYRMYLFLNFPKDANRARGWLGELVPRIATTKEVAAFNERFSAARHARGGDDPENLKAIWINVSFTVAGLNTLLTADEHKNELKPFAAFSAGSAERAASIGDVGPLSAPENWVFGGPHQDPIDALLIVAADDRDDLSVELEKQRALLTRYGLVTIFEQRGVTLPGLGRGHEHFGFKDGISQPGVKGFDFPDDMRPDQVKGHLGSDLLAPGEFILGYDTQPIDPNIPPREEPKPADPPPWMKNGSFQVIRRLQQDIPGFWAQITTKVHSLPSDDPLIEEDLGAKLVGRWRSGTPLDLSPDKDDRFTHDPKDDNDFEYENDALGHRAPRFSHIRKMYPRENNSFGNEHRRLLRRGIPFGLPFDPSAGTGYGEDAQRGLLFVAYMSSIADQFEFLQKNWANLPNFPFPRKGIDDNDPPKAGADPVIGTFPDPASTIRLRRQGHDDVHLSFQRFVHTQGVSYAFAPSISTLAKLASDQL